MEFKQQMIWRFFNLPDTISIIIIRILWFQTFLNVERVTFLKRNTEHPVVKIFGDQTSANIVYYFQYMRGYLSEGNIHEGTFLEFVSL